MTEKLNFDEIYQLIQKECFRDDESFFLRSDGDPLFRKPVMGVKQSDDHGFAALRETIPDHLLPFEIWENEFGNQPEKLSVLSYALPFDLKTVAENAAVDDCPPMSWFEAKRKCIKAGNEIAKKLEIFFRERKIQSLRPEATKSFKWIQAADGKKYPTWSQRHVGFVCGVGSFGLHGALITPMGSTHRLDSLLVDAEFDKYSETAQSPFADCLYLQKGTCGICVKRCPAGAIQLDNQRQIEKCRKQAYKTNAPKAEKALGESIGGCALCNTRVPCATKSPMKG